MPRLTTCRHGILERQLELPLCGDRLDPTHTIALPANNSDID